MVNEEHIDGFVNHADERRKLRNFIITSIAVTGNHRPPLKARDGQK